MSDKRLYFVDNLRVLLTVLVIVFHLAITYGAPIGDWPYREGQPGPVGSLVYATFVAVCQAFFMGFFFLISGYFTPGSFKRRGAASFLRERLLRLGAPLLIYLVFLDPPVSFALAQSKGFAGSFPDFIVAYVRDYDGLQSGPLWFLEALLIFASGYALLRRLVRGTSVERRFPGNGAMAVFALALGVVSFVVRIWFPLGYSFTLLNLQIPFFPQYVVLFAVGTVAYRNDWLSQFPDRAGRLWSSAAVILVVLFPVMLLLGAPDGDATVFAGGVTWQAFVLAVWEQLTCLAMIVSLTVLFQKRLNVQGKLARAMSDSAYAVYVIHASVIILLTLSLRGVHLPPLLKWAFVSGLAVPLCFAISHFLRRLPITRRIL